jgi:epoxyqueuosine reductase QueG
MAGLDLVTLAAELKTRAGELGFPASGITDPSPPPHADRLDAWLAKGYAGTMRDLHRQA